MVKELPTMSQIKNAQKPRVWDFGNSVLYKLCQDHYAHEEDQYILTKVLFIGRVYSAAIERRKNKKEGINEDFYTEIVVPRIKNSALDTKLEALEKINPRTNEGIEQILETHNYLTDLLDKGVTESKKRSFTSKYLHFHKPSFFYIYDGRAVGALRNFISYMPNTLKHLCKQTNIDEEYGKFYSKCAEVREKIKSEYGVDLSIRDFDQLLLDIANEESRRIGK